VSDERRLSKRTSRLSPGPNSVTLSQLLGVRHGRNGALLARHPVCRKKCERPRVSRLGVFHTAQMQRPFGHCVPAGIGYTPAT
jgi:hypothetical protein